MSVREIAARQSASRGARHDGPALGSASSEKGFQTALAKSPPRWARPTTACCAPLRPPGSGAIRATAVTMRTIAQAPKPKRPSRAVSTVPAAACQISRKPASTSTPVLKANSMSPTAEEVVRAGPAQEGQHLPRRAVGVGEEAALDRLRRCRIRRRNRSHGKTRGRERQRDPQQAGTGAPGSCPGRHRRHPSIWRYCRFPILAAPPAGDGSGRRAASISVRSTAADRRALAMDGVETARQRRHQGDGGDDADNRPGAEADAALPRRVDGAGGGVTDQQEAGQHQHARVEGEQHVAHGREVVRAGPAQEGQHLPRRAVGVGEEAALDRLRRCRIRRRNRSHGKTRCRERRCDPQ